MVIHNIPSFIALKNISLFNISLISCSATKICSVGYSLLPSIPLSFTMPWECQILEDVFQKFQPSLSDSNYTSSHFPSNLLVANMVCKYFNIPCYSSSSVRNNIEKLILRSRPVLFSFPFLVYNEISLFLIKISYQNNYSLITQIAMTTVEIYPNWRFTTHILGWRNQTFYL